MRSDGNSNHNRSIGLYGEQIAAEYLAARGYRILERNYRCRGGEVDIVARERSGYLVFVEVKTRRSLVYGPPQLSVTRRKQHQIIRGAQTWLTFHQQQNSLARFDVIAIMLQPDGKPQIEHIINAFELS